jgi:hypothetical protein
MHAEAFAEMKEQGLSSSEPRKVFENVPRMTIKAK